MRYLIIAFFIVSLFSCNKEIKEEVDNATYVENTLKNYKGKFTFNRDTINYSSKFNRDSFDWYVKTYLGHRHKDSPPSPPMTGSGPVVWH